MSRHALVPAIAFGFALVIVHSESAVAHTQFKKPFQKQYHYKTVTCHACHAKGKDENGKRLGKEVLNDFGKPMKKLMADRKVTDRINKAKRADSATKKKVAAAVEKDFLDAMKQLEKLKSPGGEAWGQLIREGRIEGATKAKARASK